MFSIASPGAVHTRPLLHDVPIPQGHTCYNGVMTKKQVKEILDRVLTWPPERQEDVVRMLSAMEEQDANACGLTDEQVAEIERRRADFASGRERYATDEEVAALWTKCGL